MNHVEFNRRFRTLSASMEVAERTPALCAEAYELMAELPPASLRYSLLNAYLADCAKEGVLPATVPVTTEQARALSHKEPKLKEAQKASRGKTHKAGTPTALAAQVEAHAATCAALRAEYVALCGRMATAAAAYTAAQATLQAAQARGPRPAAPEAVAMVKALKAKPVFKAAPQKGALSPAMQAVLDELKGGQTAKGLTPQQYSCARMHLVMKGLAAKSADGTYTAL